MMTQVAPLTRNEVFFAWLAIAFVIFTGFRQIWPWLQSMMNAERNYLVDASGEGIPTPDAVNSMMSSLEPLGFKRLGVSKTFIGSMIGHTWHMTSTDQTIHAEIVSY